jgi:cytochrome P450
MNAEVEARRMDFARPAGSEIHAILAWLRQHDPVAQVTFHGGSAYLVSRFEDVFDAFRDEEHIPAAVAYREHSEPAQGRTLLCMEGEEHRINRAMVFPAFAPRVIQQYAADHLEPLANELVDNFAASGSADLVADFTHEFSFQFILRMLGIPPGDHPDFHRWSIELLNYAYHPDRALRAKAEFTRYLEPLVRRRRADPGDDLLSRLVKAESEGHHLSDEEIFSFARLLFPAGADTSYLGIGNLLFGLLTHPDALDEVRADPTLRRSAIEEALRWESPAAILPRRTRDAVTIAGTRVPADTPLLFAITAANRDPSRFTEPEAFDVHRQPTGVLTFGLGPHFCLGAHLARAEMAVALDVVLGRLDGLRLSSRDGVDVVGSILRGPQRLPVTFERS